MATETKDTINDKPDPTSPSGAAGRPLPGSPPVTNPTGGSIPRRPTFPPALLVIGLLLLAVLAYFLGRSSAGKAAGLSSTAVAPEANERAGSGEKGASTEDGAPTEEGGAIKLEPKAEQTAGIQVVAARYAPLGESLTAPGAVEVSPNRGARVTPPVPGKVLRLFAAPGDRVRAGQALALLDSPEVAQAHGAVQDAEARVADARAQVQTAEAGVLQAQTKQGNARAALQRQKEFARSGQLAQPTLQAAQNELNTAEAERAQARTDLQAQSVIVARNERLFQAEIVAKAELEQSQVARQQAQTRLEETEKRVEIAQQALEREQRVYRGGLLNRQAVQTAEAEVRAAEGDVQQARKQEQATRTALQGARRALAAAQANLRSLEGNGHADGGAGRLLLHAPIAGTIAERSATLGQAVERSSELFTIQNLESVTVVANVPEANAARVRIGAPVTVTVAAYPNTRFRGVIQSIGSQVDEKTRALPVRCLVQNSKGALKPEMFTRVSLATGGTSPALVVPDAAVDEDGSERFVYVREGERYEKRAVEVGRSFGDLVEIHKGVKPGDKVVTKGLFTLKSESKKGELKGDED